MNRTRSVQDRILEDGYAFPLDALSSTEASILRNQVLSHLQESNRIGGLIARFPFSPKIHLLCEWADSLIRNTKILDQVGNVIGPNILCWGTNIFVKDPTDTTDLAWHQDALTYQLGGAQTAAVRVWISLTESSRENGTLQFAAGTHLRGIQPHRRSSRDNSGRGDESIIEVDPLKCEFVVLRPGQFSMHSMLVAHKSGWNKSAEPRVNFAIDYISTDVQPISSDPDSATLVRGTDKNGNFLLENPPISSYDTEARSEFEKSIRLRMRRLVRASLENEENGMIIDSE